MLIPTDIRHRPVVSKETEAAVVELLLPLLRPIGDWRNAQVQTSKGRGRRKRRKTTTEPTESTLVEEEHVLIVQQHLKVGFNSVMRSLEKQMEAVQPQAVSSSVPSSPPQNLAVIVVCRSVLPSPACDSLPLMVSSASSISTKTDAVRLVEITESGQMAIATAMRLPRVGMLGITNNMPSAQPFLQYIRDAFEPILVPSSTATPLPLYLPTKVKTVKTTIGVKKDSGNAKKRRKEPTKPSSNVKK